MVVGSSVGRLLSFWEGTVTFQGRTVKLPEGMMIKKSQLRISQLAKFAWLSLDLLRTGDTIFVRAEDFRWRTPRGVAEWMVVVTNHGPFRGRLSNKSEKYCCCRYWWWWWWCCWLWCWFNIPHPRGLQALANGLPAAKDSLQWLSLDVQNKGNKTKTSEARGFVKIWVLKAPFLFHAPNRQVSHDKNPGWLGYIGDHTTHLYRDNNKPL